jgi:hypothetical protein
MQSMNLLLVLQALNGIVSLGGKDKVGRNEFCALVEKLEERVLCIGARLAKEDWSSRVVDVFAVSSNGLTVGFHRKLLKICWEAVHVLVESSQN